MAVCTRFAPSPTGYLHVGGARTALYSWLYARKMGGQFVLRIEDTDKERSTSESVQAIFDGMRWLGLAHDQGPFYQSERSDEYQAVINQLLEQGHAYRCYCSKARLETLREQQMAAKIKPRYDGHCRNIEPGEGQGPFVIRFRNPEQGNVVFDDHIRGKITVANSELDDLIIARSDGSPTYNLTVVVDDWQMGITHVIRGDDHINNTPRQINILQALGAPIPEYAHVPMILGADGKRLSKRHGAVSVMQYQEAGYLPEAVLNYLVRLGWSHGDDEIFSLDQMIALFDIKHVNRAPSSFNPSKLDWLNQHYMRTLDPAYVAKALAWQFDALGVSYSQGPALTEVVVIQAERVKTVKEMAEQSRFWFEAVTEYDEKAVKKFIKDRALDVLAMAHELLSNNNNWQAEALHEVVQTIVDDLDLKFPKVAQPLRIALTGSTQSPSIDLTMLLLGQQETVLRLKQAIGYFSE